MKTVKLELLSFQRKIKEFFYRFLSHRSFSITTIPVSKCRHYCGFKYGCNSLNPYENYIIGLHTKRSINDLRKNFENFLMYYRPQCFADIFDIELSKHIPLWIYPWDNSTNFNSNNGWIDDVDKVIDIITHFCELGIKKSQIQKEYFWLERAYNQISTIGYQPNKFSYIEVFEISKKDESIFVVKDGNHRLSSLVALGYKEVMVKQYLHETVKVEDYKKWFQVILGTYSEHEALSLVNAYFKGVDNFKRCHKAAQILEY